MARRTNDATLATVIGIGCQLDADIDTALLTLRAGARARIGGWWRHGRGYRALVLLFLTFALTFPLLLAACGNVIMPVQVLLALAFGVVSAMPGFGCLQRIPTG